ncbi:MAG: YceI family protein [Pseudomarimonas sp.]
MRASLVLLAGLGVFTAPAIAADTYTIDPAHSQVRFTYNHLGFSNIVGLIGNIEGELVYDAAAPANSKVSATIPVGQIHTGVEKMDQHLYAEDFFDVAKFPNATFVSTKVEAAGEGKLKVTGDFSLHGVTKPVTLDVKLNAQGEHPMRKTAAIGFDASSSLNRSDFGVGKYAPAVSEAVGISITVEANIKAPPAG